MFEDIASSSAALATTLRPEVAETPLVRRPRFDRDGSLVFAKLESAQKTGSFKLRGATAKLKSLSPDQRRLGVVTASTGNHGAAVAHAARRLGTAATVFVSTDADPAKVEAIRLLGATITTIPGDPVDAEAAARVEAGQSGRVYVPPYNDETVVAGQGTIGVEILSQLEPIDAVIVSVGGGGLISGIAATLKHHSPATRIIGASAANSAAMHHSVAAGAIIEVPHRETLSDGTAGGLEPGTLTFTMCQQLVDQWVLVEEAAIAAAMDTCMASYDDRIEGSAGVALAAVDQVEAAGNIVVIICGGNVSDETLQSIRIDA